MRVTVVASGVILVCVAALIWAVHEPDQPRSPASLTRERGATPQTAATTVHPFPPPELPSLEPPRPTGSPPIQLQTDPRSPHYDAAKLFSTVWGSPTDFWKHEPRDEAWASEREHIITDLALPAFRDVDPNATLHVECHTGVCRISVHSRNYYLLGRLGAYPLSCLGNVAAPQFGPDITPAGIRPGAIDPYSDTYLFFDQDDDFPGATPESGHQAARNADLATERTRCNRFRQRYLAEAAAYSEDPEHSHERP